jgi:nucleoid DNA-binding protein
MRSQKDILMEVASRHGLNQTQAEDIWNLIGGKIAEVISKNDKKVDGLYDVEKFPVIHIDNFGKFIPDNRKIRHANFCLKAKHESNT